MGCVWMRSEWVKVSEAQQILAHNTEGEEQLTRRAPAKLVWSLLWPGAAHLGFAIATDDIEDGRFLERWEGVFAEVWGLLPQNVTPIAPWTRQPDTGEM